MLTGSYNKSAHIIDLQGNHNVAMPAHFDVKRGRLLGTARKYGSNLKLLPNAEVGGSSKHLSNPDFKKKV